MIYMTPNNAAFIKVDDPDRHWGQIITPGSYASRPSLARWCGDNEAFTRKFEPVRFYSWLDKFIPHADRCLFVAVPDIVGDAKGTLARYHIHAKAVRDRGFPVAFVAQDGLENIPLAYWPPFDALFIGGSTEWKLSPAADYCIRIAQQRNAWTHVGRVNSQKRIKHFQLIGVDSVDGTSLAYAPNRDFWRFQKALAQPPLFEIGHSQPPKS